MGVKLLGKMKIHEIAKELGLTSKDVIAKANELGMDVKSHLSSVEDADAEKIRNSFNIKKKESDVKTEKKQKENKVKKDDAPVIIRREVIITEDKKNEKKEENKMDNRENVGFVERRKNQDYNIVYRNKPTKPLTVNELFGIKKKEKKEERKVEPKKEEVQIKNEEKEIVKKEEKTINTDNNFNKNSSQTINQNRENKMSNNNNKNNNYKENQNNRFNNRNNYNKDRKFNNYGNNQNRDGIKYNNNNQQGRFQNNRPRPGFNKGERRPLDEKGIDKNIKNIMSNDMGEKETQRDYNSRSIDKQKINNRYEGKNKKANKNK